MGEECRREDELEKLTDSGRGEVGAGCCCCCRLVGMAESSFEPWERIEEVVEEDEVDTEPAAERCKRGGPPFMAASWVPCGTEGAEVVLFSVLRKGAELCLV